MSQPRPAEPTESTPTGTTPTGTTATGAKAPGAKPAAAKPSAAKPSGAKPSGAKPSGAKAADGKRAGAAAPARHPSGMRQFEMTVEEMTTRPRRKPLDPSIVEARKRVSIAQVALQDDLDGLSEATRSAMDIPAKIRKSPVKSAALAGGAGFLLLGGPRRVLRAVVSRVTPKRTRDPNEGLLPDEIERVLRDSGAADLPGVRAALARDFAEYLKAKGKVEARRPTASSSLWRTYDAVVGPMGTVAARVLVERLFAADGKRPSDR